MRKLLTGLWCVALFLGVLAVAREAFPAPIYGQDFLGIQQRNFNVKQAALLNPYLRASGNIANTFGTDLSGISTLIGRTVPVFYRVHILNTTCNTNNVCGPYEHTYGFSVSGLDQAVRRRNPTLLAKFNAEVARYRSLSSQFPHTTFLVSPAVEHHLSTESYRILADEVLKSWPGVQLVNSPGAGINGERYKGAWLEKHGATGLGNADIVSFDGTDATDSDIPRFLEGTRGARLVYFWTRSYNCRNQGAFEDPRKRNSCPSNSTLDLMAHIGDYRGVPPTGVACGPFKAPAVWKPLAEDKGGGDVRANKPVLLAGFGRNTVKIIDARGALVGTLGYYGPYEGGLNRYYSSYASGSGDGGYGFERKAMASAASPYVYVKDSKHCLGPLIPGRRNGAMR